MDPCTQGHAPDYCCYERWLASDECVQHGLHIRRFIPLTGDIGS